MMSGDEWKYRNGLAGLLIRSDYRFGTGTAIDLDAFDGPGAARLRGWLPDGSATVVVRPVASHPDRSSDLEVLAVSRDGRRILGLVPRIMRGAHVGHPRLRLARARRVLMESDAPLLVEADGEIAFDDARRLEIEVMPNALRVLA